MVNQSPVLATAVGEDARGGAGPTVVAVGDGTAVVGDGAAVGRTIHFLFLGLLASQVFPQTVRDGLSLLAFLGCWDLKTGPGRKRFFPGVPSLVQPGRHADRGQHAPFVNPVAREQVTGAPDGADDEDEHVDGDENQENERGHLADT